MLNFPRRTQLVVRLALDEQVIQDAVWKQTVVNKINAIKSNNDFGYKTLDCTSGKQLYSS